MITLDSYDLEAEKDMFKRKATDLNGRSKQLDW